MTCALFLFSSLHSVVAMPTSSVGVGFGQVSNIQPDSLTGIPSDLDLQDAALFGLQRHARVRKAVTSDLLDDLADIDFADSTVLGLQQSVRVKVHRKPTADVESLQADEDEDEDSTSLIGLQRSVTVQKSSRRVSSRSSRVSSARVSSGRMPTHCANVARS